MRSYLILVAITLLAVPSARADEFVCALAQIVNGRPDFWQNTVVSKDAPAELKTTNGLFTGRVIYQADLSGYSIVLKYKDITAGGFFEENQKDPVVSLHAEGLHAQINCHLASK